MTDKFLTAPLLAVVLLAGNPLAANAQTTDSSTSAPSAPIKSRAALDAYLPAMPAFVDKVTTNPSALSVWAPADDGTTLVRTALDPGPLQILVTAGCHFSEDAASDISKDPVLGPIFARHARWLLQPPGMEDQDAVRDWNRNFPAAQAVQLYDRSEWTFSSNWEMPTFFVVRNGEVVGKVSGWAGADSESRTDLLAALRRAGIAD